MYSNEYSTVSRTAGRGRGELVVEVVEIVIPLKRIDDFAASLAGVLVAAIVVHRACAGLRITPLLGMDEDVVTDEAIK